MNEELTLAVEEFRKLPPGSKWLIPVRFDDGPIPEWDLGAGRVLGDLNYVDMFGPSQPAQIASLVTTIHDLMGEAHMSPAATLEAIKYASEGNRAELVTRLTKEKLLDPAERIRLDELVSQEARLALFAINGPELLEGKLTGTNDDNIVQVCEAADRVWRSTRPFLHSLQVAARWGDPNDLGPWSNAIRLFAQAPNKVLGGYEALIKLRHLPVVLSAMTAGVACVASGRWDNFRTLVADQQVQVSAYGEALPRSILDSSYPWSAFRSEGWVPHVLANSAANGTSFAEELARLDQKKVGKLYTPVSDWMHHILRATFADQIPEDHEYDSVFDRAEVVLGTVAQDAVNVEVAGDERLASFRHSMWFGRSTWRNRYGTSPVAVMRRELEQRGADWPPVRAGLFGAASDRASAAIAAYEERFDRISSQRM